MLPPSQGLTAYHDISLDKCYVIELNTTIVLPPRNFWELLMNVKVGSVLSPPVPSCGEAKPKRRSLGHYPHTPQRISTIFNPQSQWIENLLFLSATHRVRPDVSLAFRFVLWVSGKGSRWEAPPPVAHFP